MKILMALAFVGIRDWQFLEPVFIGDTLHAESEIIAMRDKGKAVLLVIESVCAALEYAHTAVDDLGGLDVLVNNAGIPKRRWAWNHRPDEIADVLRINVE